MQTSVDQMDSEDLRAVLQGDDAAAQAFLHLLPHPADIADALSELDAEEWPRLLHLISDEEARAEVVSLLDEHEQLAEYLRPEDIGTLLRQMESDDAADLLAELAPDEQKEALEALPEEERREVLALLQYPEDSAGGIMQAERVEVQSQATVDEAISQIRNMVDEGIDVHKIFVIDAQERLLGTVELVDLLLHAGAKKLADLMTPPVATAHPLLDQEEVVGLFRKYDLVVLPVVDGEGRLLGRIVHDDVVDVLDEEAEEDVLRMAGTDAEELLYRDRALAVARVRMPWLLVNLFGSLVSGWLLHLYEPVIAQAILIASFIPVITAMGGNVGTQSATILTRGFATGRLDLGDVPRLVFKEFRVGLLMGLLCGGGVSLIATFLFADGRYHLGLVVWVAMVAAMTTAAVVGTLAPAAMKRLGIDPAIASGPFVTTANDIIGIVLYMSTAVAFLDQLTGA